MLSWAGLFFYDAGVWACVCVFECVFLLVVSVCVGVCVCVCVCVCAWCRCGLGLECGGVGG